MLRKCRANRAGGGEGDQGDEPCTLMHEGGGGNEHVMHGHLPPHPLSAPFCPPVRALAVSPPVRVIEPWL